MRKRFATIGPPEGDTMPRGNTPRQPSRSGRHEGARRQSRPLTKPLPGRAIAVTEPQKSKLAKIASKKKADSYDPRSPERVRAILDGLDRMYPGATCALTHRNAWELVVATILSA